MSEVFLRLRVTGPGGFLKVFHSLCIVPLNPHAQYMQHAQFALGIGVASLGKFLQYRQAFLEFFAAGFGILCHAHTGELHGRQPILRLGIAAGGSFLNPLLGTGHIPRHPSGFVQAFAQFVLSGSIAVRGMLLEQIQRNGIGKLKAGADQQENCEPGGHDHLFIGEEGFGHVPGGFHFCDAHRVHFHHLFPLGFSSGVAGFLGDVKPLVSNHGINVHAIALGIA